MSLVIINYVIDNLDIVVIHSLNVLIFQHSSHSSYCLNRFWLTKLTILMRTKQIFFNVSFNEKLSGENIFSLLADLNA